MAMTPYTGGGYSNYTSYYTPTMPLSYHYVPPTPRYDLDSGHTRMSLWHEERRRREESDFGLVPAGGAAAAALLGGLKRRKKKGHSVKRRELEEGAEESGQSGEEVSAQCGDDVILPCHAPKPDSVDGLEWTRSDLDENQYVYLYKDGQPDLTEQHQDYRGRCELKDGTATLLLKNVTAADSGTYECRFIKHDLRVSKRSIIGNDPVSVVRLQVGEAGACADPEEEEDEGEEEEVDTTEGTEIPPYERPHYERHHYVAMGAVGLYVVVVVLLGFIMV